MWQVEALSILARGGGGMNTKHKQSKKFHVSAGWTGNRSSEIDREEWTEEDWKSGSSRRGREWDEV